MSTPHNLFDFSSQAYGGETFHVVRFQGKEGLSRIFRFEITLVSTEDSIDADKMLQEPASLTAKTSKGAHARSGVLASFRQLHKMDKYVFYKAVLVPRLWWLTLTNNHQIFLHKNFKDILWRVLKQGGLASGVDFDLRLAREYPAREYVCQHMESHYDFLARWMERYGIYYYFEQSKGGEKAVVVDSSSAHQSFPGAGELDFGQPSGMSWERKERLVYDLRMTRSAMPQKVRLKDYNYRNPSDALEVEQTVDAQGVGEVYLYGDHFQSDSEGETMASALAESWLCREQRYHGASKALVLRSGYTFELSDHPNETYNQKYLVLEATHEANQEAWLATGLGLPVSHGADNFFYRNTFTAIPAETQYRPERKTRRAACRGAMNARIWTEGSDEYAEVDQEGRYTIRLPFDLSGRAAGKASHWVRMAQPYGGKDHGLHFPLHKGTEVLLTHIDGDPDRPVILAAVPNPDTPSVVDSSTETMCLLTTSGQNCMHFQDKKDNQQIFFKSPAKSAWMQLGNKGNGAREGVGISTEGDRTVTLGKDDTETVGGDYKRTVGGDMKKTVQGQSTTNIHGDDQRIFKAAKSDTTLASKLECKLGGGIEHSPKWSATVGTQMSMYVAKAQQVKQKVCTQLSSTEASATTNTQTSKSFSTVGFNLGVGMVSIATYKRSTNMYGVNLTAYGGSLGINLINVGVSLMAYSTVGSSTAITLCDIKFCGQKTKNSGDQTKLGAVSISMAGDRNEEHGAADELAGLNFTA
jgi:type VI secretion system secreted protein VgrG